METAMRSNAGLSSMTAMFFQFFDAFDDGIKLPFFLLKVLLCKLCCTLPWFASAQASVFSSQLLRSPAKHNPKMLRLSISIFYNAVILIV
jgi:hypothetical protein